VTAPAGTRVGDLSGLKVTATYNGGSETAVVLTSGGYAYLLVRRIGTGAPAFRVQQAAASLASFRPV